MSIKIYLDVPSVFLSFLGVHNCSASVKGEADFIFFSIFFPYDYSIFFRAEGLLLQKNNVIEKSLKNQNFPKIF